MTSHFAYFRDLVLILVEVFFGKRFSQKFRNIHKKASFLSCNFIKNKTLAQRFSCGFCKIFKNTFFTEHLWRELLALYFVIIYSWQLSSNEKSIVGEKVIHMSKRFYRFRFIYLFISLFIYLYIYFFIYLFIYLFFYLFIYLFISFFSFHWQIPVTLLDTQNVCCTRSSQPFCWLGNTYTQCFWPILKI